MNSDSESQDSDDGRRFRFATTRKDSVPQPRKTSPQLKHKERRSRSRDRSSRYRDESSHKKQSSSEANNKNLTKNRTSKEARSSSRDRSSKRHEKESRNQRKSYDSKESKISSSNKHKSKPKEKHKKRSRDRSREKSSKKSDEVVKSDKRKVDSDKSETEEEKTSKKHCIEDHNKVIFKNMDKKNEIESRNSKDILGDNVTVPVVKKSKSYFDRVVKKNVVNDDNFYGPVLPPKLEKDMIIAKDNEKDIEKTVNYQTKIKEIGPSLPVHLKLPLTADDTNNKLEEKKEISVEKEVKLSEKEKDGNGNVNSNDEDDNEDTFGPVLPPQFHRHKIVGPILPAEFVPATADEQTANRSSDSEEDFSVGPLPADHPANQDSFIQLQLEYRAQKVKEKFMEKTSPEKNKREEWMTELPPAHAVALGLGSIPRKFKSSEGPDMSDRTMWTDTPADKLKKQKEKEENRFVPAQDSSNGSKKDKEKPEVVEERKGESLLDMHLKTLKKKKKKLEKEAKELGLSTRKPFNRDEDLQTNRLDQARKKKIFEKANRLNDRFTVGKM